MSGPLSIASSSQASFSVISNVAFYSKFSKPLLCLLPSCLVSNLSNCLFPLMLSEAPE